jgi:peptidoglycan/LPS O-acetylase OafA/YrhL
VTTATAPILIAAPAPAAVAAAPPKPARFLELDALRGIAAVSVMLFHYTSYARSHHQTGLWFDVPWGHYGVQLFFIISGFVIIMTANRAATVGEFAVSRFARLYPAYWTACAFTYTLVQLAQPHARHDLVNAVLNLPMIEIAGVARIENVYWTLQQEMWFYIVIAGLILVRRTNLALWAVAAIVVTSLCGLRFTRWFSLFLIGMVLFDSMKGLQPKHYLFLALAAADVLVRSFVYKTKDVIGWEYPLAVLVCAVLVFMGTRVRVPWLTNRVLLFLGTISYSLYLIHATLGGVIIKRMIQSGVNINLAILAAVTASLAIATSIAFLIERPAMRAIRARFAPKAQSRSLTVPS